MVCDIFVHGHSILGGLYEKKVTVYYRKLDRSNSDVPDDTLEELIKGALQSVSQDWRRRSMDTGKDSNLFTNIFSVTEQGLFGDVCAFSQAQMQALLDTTNEQAANPNVDVNEMTAPEGQDFLLGMAHWFIVGDHVLLVQGAHLYARQIQEYFDWLLREATQTLVSDSPLSLTAVFDATEIGEPGDAQSIEIGGAVASSISADTIARSERVDASEWARNIFKIVSGEARLAQLTRELPNESQLKAKVIFNFSKRKRDIDVNALQGLSGALQDLPHSQVKIKDRQGTISNNDARLHMDMTIKKVNKNGILLDQTDTFSVLNRVYRRFLEDEKIS